MSCRSDWILYPRDRDCEHVSQVRIILLEQVPVGQDCSRVKVPPRKFVWPSDKWSVGQKHWYGILRQSLNLPHSELPGQQQDEHCRSSPFPHHRRLMHSCLPGVIYRGRIWLRSNRSGSHWRRRKWYLFRDCRSWSRRRDQLLVHSWPVHVYVPDRYTRNHPSWSPLPCRTSKNLRKELSWQWSGHPNVQYHTHHHPLTFRILRTGEDPWYPLLRHPAEHEQGQWSLWSLPSPIRYRWDQQWSPIRPDDRNWWSWRNLIQ